jgi:hypothetical protein
MAIIMRGNASPEPFSVCTYSGLASADGRYRMPARLAWKSPQLEQELTSSHSFHPGAQTSTS